MALIKCPNCGKEVSDKANRCVQCGYEFVHQEIRFCQECGTEIPIGATECPNCGFPIYSESVSVNNYIKTSGGNTKRKYIIGIVALLSIMLIVSIVILFVLSYNPINKYNNLVNSGKEDEASKLYKEKIADNKELLNELTDTQNAEMDEIYNNFVSENVSYDEAIEFIDKYLLYDASREYAGKTKDKIQKLNISRNAYSDAVEAEKQENFEHAIKRYKAVISDDPLYNEAQSKISELTEKWKNQLLTEAENFCSNRQYKEAANCIDDAISAFGSSDELLELKEKYVNLKSEQYAKITVTDKSVTPKDSSKWIFSNYVNFIFDITNNSDKNIKGIEGSLTVNDLFGKEIITMGCDFTGINIAPTESYTVTNLSYECNEFRDDDMKLYNTAYSDLQFVYDISSIVYEDGTTVKPE